MAVSIPEPSVISAEIVKGPVLLTVPKGTGGTNVMVGGNSSDGEAVTRMLSNNQP